MASKKPGRFKRVRAAARLSPIEAARQIRRADIESDYAARHPERAAEQRAMRKAQAVAAKEFDHKRAGTIETHAKAARISQGALARLYATGAITADDLAAAQEIAAIVERIESGVAVRTASLETKVDVSRGPDTGHELLSRARREQAYSRWRRMIPAPRAAVVDMVARDLGYTLAARRHRIGNKRARSMLVNALELWPECKAWARSNIDKQDVERVDARLA